MFDKLRKDVYDANMYICGAGIAPFTWGNASGVDRGAGVFAIKPSGVPYDRLSPDDIVVLDLEGNVVCGSARPSSDTPTHLVLYNSFPELGGIVHTHSAHAVAWAQSGREIPPYGTTHADFCRTPIPCTRALTVSEVAGDYEKNTGLVIAQCFGERGFDPLETPAVLVRSHGPFAFGADAASAAVNAAVLEMIAGMALETEALSHSSPAGKAREYLLKKHYERKHGRNAYYGQPGAAEAKGKQ